MVKKTSSSNKIEATVSKKPATKSAVSTPVRNSAIPKLSPASVRKSTEITTDLIARKAYEIFASGTGGSELDNWFAAERALRQAA